jgi:hypothetical protein
MSDDENPYGDLADMDDLAADASESDDESTSDAAAEPETSAVDQESAVGESVDTPDRTTSDPLEQPAFPYSECRQRPLYAPAEAWDGLEDLELDVQLALREEGVRNLEGRELHNAVLRFAAEHPEEVADVILEERRDANQ